MCYNLFVQIKRGVKIMEEIKRNLYQYLLNQLQECVHYALNNCAKNTQNIIDFLKKVESDFNIMAGVINCLLLRKEDFFNKAFKIIDEHPIIYCYSIG